VLARKGVVVDREGILTARFDHAVAYALAAHDTHRRKGTDVPYAAHLLGVASLILEAGGSEDEAIAGLLHDVVEDQGGAPRLDDVRQHFGDHIADLVLECSAEAKTDDPGWRVRKERYLDGIGTCSESALLVSLADKVYNARSIVEDLRLAGPSMFDRFGADEPKDQSILWYYRSLVAAYSERPDASRRLLGELERTVDDLGGLIESSPS
jgi:(p)ppGpp synthase/HD superfamily hydrolase